MMSSPSKNSDHRNAVRIAAIGTIAVTAYAALAALQIFVLNPLAAAPGRDLRQIRADMAGFGESLSSHLAIPILSTGVVLALVLFVAIVAIKASTPLIAMTGYLVLLAFGAPAYFMASFGAGMGLADTYMISGGDHSPWAIPLYLVSGLALLTPFALGAAGAIRRHRRIARPLAS